MADTNIIRNFDALRETFTLNPTDHIMVGQRRGGLGNLAPRRIEANTFATQFFGLDTVQTLLCNFLDGAVESIGAGIPVYEGFDATTCMAQFRTLTAGTNVTLDDTTNPGEIIINASGGGAHVIQDGGVPLVQQPALNFIGATVTDNPGNNSTDVTIAGGGGGPLEEGVFTENATAAEVVSVDTLGGGNPIDADSVAGKYVYNAIGNLLFVSYEVLINLDAQIGAPTTVRAVIKDIPTPGNISSSINAAIIYGTGTIEGLNLPAYTSTGVGVATILSTGGIQIIWSVRGSQLGATTEAILLKAQMMFTLN